jgi:serine protease Do
LVALLIASFTACLRAQAPDGHAPGMLGIALDEVEAPDANRLRLPGVYGAWVRAVGPASPAEKAGMQADDVVVEYNGHRVESAMALRRMVQETPAGRTVEIKVIRSGNPALMQTVLGTGSVSSAMPSTPATPRSLGVWIEAVAPAVGEYLGLDQGIGMIVRQVQPDSAADRAGILAKDILIAVNALPVTGAEVVATQVNETSGPDVLFTLLRGGEQLELTVRF